MVVFIRNIYALLFYELKWYFRVKYIAYHIKRRTKHNFTVDNLGLSTVNFRLRTTISIVNNLWTTVFICKTVFNNDEQY